MLSLSDDELKRWVVEIEDSRDFRDKEFGEYRRKGNVTTGAGQNLDWFDYGSSVAAEGDRAPVNLAFVLQKNIVPLLFPQRPKVLGLPTRKEDAASAPIAASLLNHYVEFLRLKQTDQHITFDTWVLGYGVSKVGYISERGSDVARTKADDRQRLRDRLKSTVESTLVTLGLKKEAKQPDPPPVEVDQEFIRVENPYLRWVDPFDFLMDARGRAITDCMWVGEEYRRTLHSVKENAHYGRAKHDLKPTPIDNPNIPSSQMERFQTVELVEVHYKNVEAPNGVTVLILGAANAKWVPLYHEHNVYERLQGWQYSLLTFNKHNHRLYPVSDLTQVRPLLYQFNQTFAAILEQVQKFVAKIVVWEEKLTPQGETALLNNEIGSVVKVLGEPRSAIMPLNLEQLSKDLTVLIERLLDLVVLVSGLTKAQLTGLSTAQTATEAQIGQGGTTNRRLDQTDAVLDFLNEQVGKLWSVLTQFVDLETVQLLSGETSYAQEDSNLPLFSFLPEITPDQAETLRHGEYRFDIEVTSTQRPNLEILRKQVENMAVVLTNSAIHQQLALQGKMLDVAEGLRLWLKLYPELIADVNRLIRPITQNVLAGLQGTPPNGHGGDRGGAAEAVRQAPPPNTADLISAAAGEKGQGTVGA